MSKVWAGQHLAVVALVALASIVTWIVSGGSVWAGEASSVLTQENVATRPSSSEICQTFDIDLNRSMTGRLPRENCEHHYYLTLTSRTAVTIDLESDDFNAFLRLDDNWGNPITYDDDSGSGSNARLELTLEPATYEVIVLSVADSGSYELTVVGQADASPPSPPPAPTPAPSPTTWSLVATGSPSGGGRVEHACNLAHCNDRIFGTSDYFDGGTATLTAQPNSGYLFSHWTGAATGSKNPTTVHMDSDKSVTAVFVRDRATRYTLTATADPADGAGGYVDIVGGTKVRDGVKSFAAGETASIVARANAGWRFVRWSGDTTGTSESLSVAMDRNKNVKAIFEVNPSTRSTCYLFGVTLPHQISGVLEASDCQDTLRRNGYYADIYFFTLNKKTEVVINLTSSVFDTFLQLRRADGDRGRVAYNDDIERGNLNSRIGTELEPGQYQIIASSYKSGASGRYQLQMDFVATASLDDPAVRRVIAEKYRPILWFHEDEKYFPVAVEAMTHYSVLHCESDFVTGPPVDPDLLGKLATRGLCNSENDYLDMGEWQRIVMRNNWWFVLESDNPGIGDPVVYYRVAEIDGWVTVQYWLFYVYNDAPFSNLVYDGDHEGDWEGIQLWFAPYVDISDIALGTVEPSEVGFAAHERGTYPSWLVSYVDGYRPEVYVAEGTHASYHAPGEWAIRAKKEVLGKDLDLGDVCTVDDEARRGVKLEQYRLESVANASWLSWDGRWGADGGPQGPASEPKPHWEKRPTQIEDWVPLIRSCRPD